jgi:hypothetical protein
MNGQPKSTFSLKQLLVAVAVASIPLALSTAYWKNVTDTTDELPVPLANAGLASQALFLAFMLVSVLIIACVGYFLISSRRFVTLAVLVLLASIATPFVYQWTQKSIISPPNGSATAELNNDACCIAAIAMERFVTENWEWAKEWNDLRPLVQQVINEINEKRTGLANPANPFAGSDPLASTEENQSIFARIPEIPDSLFMNIENYVDVNFDFEISDAKNQTWQDFTGIRPHKPAYNLYRVELRKLIESLNQR